MEANKKRGWDHWNFHPIVIALENDTSLPKPKQETSSVCLWAHISSLNNKN